MLKTSYRLSRLGRTALMSASLATGVTGFSSWVSPARADLIITGGYPQVIQQAPSSIIYGSPIPAPVPVNPVTGSFTSSTSYYGVYPGSYGYGGYGYGGYGYSGYGYGGYGRATGSVVNSTLINPTVVNSSIYNSTLINPRIIDSSRYTRRVGVPVYPRRVIRGSFGISF